ncbi:MAG: Gfo/Idh/MocA family oxidoreductase [Opitutae bacterium]|nr:Gfo/Idh/MocA family oxidoreductase [Opitutae bacterium]
MKKIRWGILGTGRIARAFAEGLKNTSNGYLNAVGSRSEKSAHLFAKEWNIEHFFGSYIELAKSTSIDAVYIATPHTEHNKNAIICLEHGKAVLCEKPFAVNASQVKQMIQKAKEENMLLMEGMWSRFPPLMEKVRNIIANHEIGEIRTIHADFGFRPETKNIEGRLFNPKLAGGSLLDVGIYPVSLSFMLNGKPDSFVTDWTIGETGVDEQASIIFKYLNGSMAVLHSSIQSDTGQEAFISGTEGTIRIHKQCWKPQSMTLSKWKTDETKEIEIPFIGNGFNYEAEHFGELLIEGKKESPIMPLSESLEIIKTLDEIRNKWGLSYPFE